MQTINCRTLIWSRLRGLSFLFGWVYKGRQSELISCWRCRRKHIQIILLLYSLLIHALPPKMREENVNYASAVSRMRNAFWNAALMVNNNYRDVGYCNKTTSFKRFKNYWHKPKGDWICIINEPGRILIFFPKIFLSTRNK